MTVAIGAQTRGPTGALTPQIESVLRAIKAADKGLLAVSEEDGRFLRVLVAARGAKSILEIGAASGYSGIWLGLGARETGGRVVAIEYDPQRAKEAADNVRKAGVADVVRVVQGDAFAEIPKLAGAFDLVFLDAWKPDYKKFFDMVYPAAERRRRLRGAQRREQEERDGAVPADHPDAPVALHDDRVAVGRRHVGVATRRRRVKPVHIIGVPLDLGGGRRGVDMGPSAFRIAGLGDRIAALGCSVVDKGDLPAPIPETQQPADERKKYIGEIARVCQRLYDVALKSLEAGALPLVLGGDHSLAAGSVAASAAWVRRTASRPLGPHLGRRARRHEHAGDDDQRQRARHAARGAARQRTRGAGGDRIDRRRCCRQHTVLVGIRNLDEKEKARIRESGVHVFTMKDIDRDGIATVAERAIALAADGTGGLHVSFDMDVCDPSIAPGVGTPVKGGLDYREAHMVMELVADSRRLVALDLVEVNPTLDIRNTTAEFATELALSALGKGIL